MRSLSVWLPASILVGSVAFGQNSQRLSVDTSQKATIGTERTAELKSVKTQWNARLAIIDADIQELKSAEVLADMQIDQQYKNFQISLADYAEQKNRLLEDTHAKTQSLYDLEIALTNSYKAWVARR